jgi:hypothetical protein
MNRTLFGAEYSILFYFSLMVLYYMKRILSVIFLVLLSACATQQRYTLDEFRGFHPFEATVIKVVELPGPPTFHTALSGPDKQIWLRTVQGDVIVLDKVPTSIEGKFCGTINTWLELKTGTVYAFPDLLRPQPHCIEVYSR